MMIAPQGLRVIWAEPLAELAVKLRTEAVALRTEGADIQAHIRERDAERLEQALAQATVGEWMLTDDVAPLLRITPDGLRAQCRRKLRARGLAEKRGGRWFVHVRALNAA